MSAEKIKTNIQNLTLNLSFDSLSKGHNPLISLNFTHFNFKIFWDKVNVFVGNFGFVQTSKERYSDEIGMQFQFYLNFLTLSNIDRRISHMAFDFFKNVIFLGHAMFLISGFLQVVIMGSCVWGCEKDLKPAKLDEETNARAVPEEERGCCSRTFYSYFIPKHWVTRAILLQMFASSVAGFRLGCLFQGTYLCTSLYYTIKATFL